MMTWGQKIRRLWYRTLLRLINRHPGLVVLDVNQLGRAKDHLVAIDHYVATSGHLTTTRGKTPKAYRRLRRDLRTVASHLFIATKVNP